MPVSKVFGTQAALGEPSKRAQPLLRKHLQAIPAAGA